MKKSRSIFFGSKTVTTIELFSLAFARANVAFKLDVRRDGQDGLDHLMSVRHAASGRPDLIMLDSTCPGATGARSSPRSKATNNCA
jgi:hypothetical protein